MVQTRVHPVPSTCQMRRARWGWNGSVIFKPESESCVDLSSNIPSCLDKMITRQSATLKITDLEGSKPHGILHMRGNKISFIVFSIPHYFTTQDSLTKDM
ncbi:uncharacterized protein LOC113004308 isoform X2 [Solenopsis invicta]|uniref:uncharacterized protein LOC113004308 isoform X2 n=1 Tax=Solenopsis invicta TaxID=13686 RepID=UPI000E33F80E|nr:uncharacterized protein LOC113004308 isoform X2 [Solenopsis invicta]